MGPKHFVATGFIVRDGRTLLLWHHKMGMWLPPGGHIDEGELPEEALVREIREETGLEVVLCSPRRAQDPSDGRVRPLHVPNHVQLEDIPNGHPQHIDLIYYCRALPGEVRLSPREHGRFRWHSPEELHEPHVSGEVRRSGIEAIEWVAARSEEAASRG
jgi:8-oxo-dGTP pyrophosphatase MutT (NUDIX family)